MNFRTAIVTAMACGTLALPLVLNAQQSTTPMPSTHGGAGQQVSGNDRDFLENAAQAGHAEIEGSKLALNKTANPDVKAFAEKMVADHTKVGDELTALAKQKGYIPPTHPSLVQATKIKALGLMSGESFDKSYANQIGVSAHEDAVRLFQETAGDAKDPDIKAFAAKHLPALKQHLEMARALKQKVDPAR